MNGTRPTHALSAALALSLVGVFNGPAWAGNPLQVSLSGQPFVWPHGGRDIVHRTDPGKLGPISHADTVAQTAAAFALWEDVQTATASFVDGGPLPEDVDVTNFVPYLDPPRGTAHVIHDDDGSICQLLVGDSYGFALVHFDEESGEIASAVVALSGNSFAGPGALTFQQFFEVQVHEIGHLLGLAHTVVNRDVLFGDFTGPAPHDTFPRPTTAQSQETMGGDLGFYELRPLLHTDDRAMFSTFYPEPDYFARSGTITGRVLSFDGRTPVNGVNVVARNVANPFHDAVSAVSGNFAGVDFSTPGAAHHPRAGVYTLNGLTPGATYAVYVQGIYIENFQQRFFRTVLPGPEEFHGVGDSSDPDTDDPAVYAPLTVAAGSPLRGVDIVFNRRRPGPVPMEYPYSVELALPFSFEFAGQKYRSVFLNTTVGTLTFGEPPFPLYEPDFVSAVIPFRHLPEPPSIAGLLSHLAPQAGGTVSFDQTRDSFTVHYTDVPSVNSDFTLGGPNTFSITLHARRGRQPNRVTLAYGDIEARGGVAGYSAGSRVATRMEPESDLSALAGRLIRGGNHPAIYEDFSGQDNDLDHLTLVFEMPDAFTDRFEPNDSWARARRVHVPFDTAREFTDITPGDVDFYRFRARAGEIVVAETAPGGHLDTRLGLFGPHRTLLAESEGFVPFPSSFARVIYTVPADGEYVLGVTTTGDPDFSGAGSESGRYALTLNAYRGTVLPLNGDDVTVEVPLGFAFPFQRAVWSSVWVSSNGNLAFGAPEPVTSVADLQLPGFLSGPPRIAPFFTDLDPSGTYNGGLTGLVIAEQKARSLTVHWVSVPNILSRETNSFSVTLDAKGAIEMGWGAITGSDRVEAGTITGITQGNGAADPGTTDLTRACDVSPRGTTYEQFTEPFSSLFRRPFNVASFDLSFARLRLLPEGDEGAVRRSQNSVKRTAEPVPAPPGGATNMSQTSWSAPPTSTMQWSWLGFIRSSKGGVDGCKLLPWAGPV